MTSPCLPRTSRAIVIEIAARTGSPDAALARRPHTRPPGISSVQ
ncbi:conserved hypothetical protein [Burkholderia pseudomallei Pakistan 9]|uniref:Uncharacterized protein n=1 Tax=Burkholderia pseudomallei 1710a TaxID=320371 RepID=A0A0E1WC81_BURPE|nr:conserved hypothetical protein [Burkholderia pseudomallei MSHR346]EDS87421.1 hypothetical protein BURPSS13_P1047 [Burkholderia pseudomallei S13]EEH23818.1 conserved hypothetical protein [Burkholderia pseudomallei Pakistan 9]EET10014.1 hypothetical protein BURPS1710A_2937 [Burkholderia pseudomallei 1710a]